MSGMMGGHSSYSEREKWRTLVRLFPSDPHVAREGNRYWLTSARFVQIDDASEIHTVAWDVLTQLNATARLCEPGFRPVRLDGHLLHVDQTGQEHRSAVVVLNTAIEARSWVTSGNNPNAPEPARYVELAGKHPHVAEVFKLFAKPDRDVSLVDLYKVVEIVKDDIKPKRLDHTGWITQAELSAIGATTNRPDISGDEARHARQPGAPPARRIAPEDARQPTWRLVRSWLASLP